jgi:hypothetical protein
MNRDLYEDLAVALTGCDCRATAAFLRSAAKDVGTWQVRAAAAHWLAADEQLQNAIGSHIGFCEPTNERPPANAGVMLAYDRALEWAANLVGEPQG